MRFSSLILGIVLIVALAGLSEGFLFNAQAYQNMFRTFITNFKKKYTSTQFAQALIKFKRNVDQITNLNNAKRGATFAVNKFSDLDPKEFRTAYLGARVPTSMPPVVSFLETEEGADADKKKVDIPAAFTWSNKNAFIKPQFQDSCGSCWSFTAATMLEGAMHVSGKNTNGAINLSEQYMLSCTKGAFGCKGGFYTTPLNAIKSGALRGIFSEAQYPYKNKETPEICSETTPAPLALKIKTVASLPNKHEEVANAIVKYGAIGIAMNADPIQFYKSGIYDGLNCTLDVNHAMALVGYGKDADANGVAQDHYIIRNSWGDWWGESGYFRIRRSDSSDICGVRKYASYVTLE